MEPDDKRPGMTRKQFFIQTANFYIQLLLGVLWLVTGIRDHKPLLWIMGIIFILLCIASIVYMLIQWRRNPITDPELDARLGKEFKDSTIGVGIVVGIIAVGFLLAFGLVAILM